MISFMVMREMTSSGVAMVMMKSGADMAMISLMVVLVKMPLS
jgi:hypothetical protein